MELTPFECFNYVKQEYLICVTVHKARNLSIFNADTYVKVTVDKKHKTTSVYKNSENPYFNEYFVFELFCTFPELLRLTVLFEIKKKSCCVDNNIGELFIDLATVWNQPGHQFYRKWGKLENPLGKTSIKTRGHLQIDLSIISKTEPPTPAISEPYDYDDIENNLLLIEENDKKSCNVRYHVIFYDGNFTKKADYLIQVSFAGMNAKTRPIKSTQYPTWNESIRFNYYYPSLTKVFFIQIMCREFIQWKCISDYEIHFDEICFPDSLPCLGPTYIHFSDPLNTFNYIGKLLLEIKIENIDVPNARRDVNIQLVTPINEQIFWNDENFVIELLMWQGDFIHTNSNNMKISVKCGKWDSSHMEFVLHKYNLSDLKYFEQDIPHKSISLKTHFPDCREKLSPDILIGDFSATMKKQLEIFKMFEIRNPGNRRLHAKCLKALIATFEEFIEKILTKIEYNGDKTLTDWDKNFRSFLNEFLKNTLNNFQEYRKNLKTKTKNFLNNIEITLKNLLIKSKEIETILSLRIQDNWPDLILNLWTQEKIIAYCKLDPKMFMYSKQEENCGRLCGKRQQLIFKPLKCPHTCECCGCIYAKIDGFIWIGTMSERSLVLIKNGWKQIENYHYTFEKETYFNCKIYVHQAKIRPGSDITGLCDPKVRITFLNCQKETNVIYKTLSPVWSETITFENLIFPGPCEYYVENPPLVALELYDVDSEKSSDYLGCTLLRLAVKPLKMETLASLKILYEKIENEDDLSLDKLKPKELEKFNEFTTKNTKHSVKTKLAIQKFKDLKKLFPPPLKWIPVACDAALLAEILASGEFIEIKEPREGSDTIINIDISENIPKEILPVMGKYKIEIFFVGLRNWHKTFNLSKGKYKMKCLFSDLCLYSGPCKTRMNESFNFMDPYVTGTCSLPEQLEYWPPLIFAHVETSKNNQEVTIGASLVSASHKYLEVGKDIIEMLQKTIKGTDMGEPQHLVDYFGEKTPLIKNRKNSSMLSGITKFTKNKVKMLTNNLKTKVAGSENISMMAFEKEDYNWWTKFYNSLRNEIDENNNTSSSSSKLKHKLIIYGSELEKQSEFEYFQDWAEPIHMVRGIKKRKNHLPHDESYCTLKCNIKIKSYDTNNLKSLNESITTKNNNSINLKMLNTKYDMLNSLTDEIKVFIRIYIVRGMNLRSYDVYSQADPFLKLQFGSQKINDRLNYLQNQSNPIFGKRFEFEGIIPREHILHISVYDRGMIDDLIGCTCIDLEDRLRSKYRAGTGISKEYSTTGYNKWRDYSKPSEILKEICLKNGLTTPSITGGKIEVDGIKFEDSTEISKNEDILERLSLSVLKRLNEIPSLGYNLVPEHVETRSLFRDDRPGVEQGKLQMWVEIYENDKIPPPIDITPISAKNYELRVIVWNTSDVLLQEKNIFGSKMSDIYVKGWLQDSAQAQYTDVHYRSLTGKGNFNWRMVFPLKYSKIEEMMVITTKGATFEQYDNEIKCPAIFHIQIWDNDIISADDFLGSLEIDLAHLIEPSTSASKCKLPSLKDNKKKIIEKSYIDLFTKKTIKGWFPTTAELKNGTIGMTGKVELELEVFTEEEAELNPVGLGREPPNALPFPNRPDTSFPWYSNPLKSIKLILLPALKKICIPILIIFVIIILMYGIIISIPGKIIDKIIPI